MARRPSPPRKPRPNTAQLRAAMRSGRTPTIDSAHEPAAASFDTDDEAAGRPPQAAAIEQALAHERRVERRPARSKSDVVAPLLIAAALLAIAVVAWILLRW